MWISSCFGGFFACHVSFLPLTICHHSPGCPCGSNEQGSSMWLVLVCENRQATCHENSFPGLFKERVKYSSAPSCFVFCSLFRGASVSSYLAWGYNQWTYSYVFYRCSVQLWPSHSVPQFKGIIPFPPPWERYCEANSLMFVKYFEITEETVQLGSWN